jgi:hypothetical protein
MSKAGKVLDRLILATDVQNKSQLAEFLEITPQSIRTAEVRKEIPDTWLYKVAYKTGTRIEWLRSGEGPQTLQAFACETMAHYGEQVPSEIQVLEAFRGWLDDDEKQILARGVELLAAEDKETRDTMRQAIQFLARKLLWRWAVEEPKMKAILDTIRTLPGEEDASTVQRCADLLASGDDLVRQHVIAAMKLLERDSLKREKKPAEGK